MKLSKKARSGILVYGILASGMLVSALRSHARPIDWDRDNVQWVSALAPYPERYRGLSKVEVQTVKTLEERYRTVMDALTVVDGMGGDHGRYHRTKPEREQELQAILKELPTYPAAPRLILAALDDVYLGHHNNGWWGYWWHWPYFDCAKAIALADRLTALAPELEEEALWTKFYCYRVKGWAEDPRYEGREPQERWTSDADQARKVGAELLTKHPGGKYAARVTALLGGKDLVLTLPGYPVMGRTRPGGGYATTVRRYDGPEFVIER